MDGGDLDAKLPLKIVIVIKGEIACRRASVRRAKDTGRLFDGEEIHASTVVKVEFRAGETWYVDLLFGHAVGTALSACPINVSARDVKDPDDIPLATQWLRGV